MQVPLARLGASDRCDEPMPLVPIRADLAFEEEMTRIVNTAITKPYGRSSRVIVSGLGWPENTMTLHFKQCRPCGPRCYEPTRGTSHFLPCISRQGSGEERTYPRFLLEQNMSDWEGGGLSRERSCVV